MYIYTCIYHDNCALTPNKAFKLYLSYAIRKLFIKGMCSMSKYAVFVLSLPIARLVAME